MAGRSRAPDLQRMGNADPVDLEAYCEAGGFQYADLPSETILREIRESGLRGRGGAGFPASIKWDTVAAEPSQTKYLVCNADEGDSGTFADRLIMEQDPYLLLEGMALAARAVGASQGYIYLRSEYPRAALILREAISRWRACPELSQTLSIELFIGAGAYICGEETSLLESLEGKRGLIRAKPPLPAKEGLMGQPTLVHNVLTLCSVPWIVRQGGASYASFGEGASTGTMPFQLSGNVRHGGIIEIPFGLPLRALIERYGGGTLAVALLARSRWEVRSAPIFCLRHSTRRSLMRPCRRLAQASVMAASWCLTIKSIWSSGLGQPSNSARSSPAGSAPLAD